MTAPLDLHSPDFLRKPDEGLAMLRSQGQLVRMKLPIIGEVWVTTDFDTARELLVDAENFVRNPANAGGLSLEQNYWWFPRFIHPLFRNVTLMDGEDLQRLRRLVIGAFSSRGIDAMKPAIERIADELLDALPQDREIDLVDRFNRRFPMLVICELLGIPEEDRPKIQRWMEPLGRVSNPFTVFRALPGLYHSNRYFRRDFETVRRTGRPGLIKELVEARDGNDKLNDDELLAMVTAIFIGGFDTTTHLIGNCFMTLLTDPTLAASLQEDLKRVNLFIEEVLRFHSPVMFTNMFHATGPVKLGGRMLERGDRVVPLLIGANRDPAKFDGATTFQADRKPNKHLDFGIGVHMCIGTQLARAEATVAVNRLFTKYPDVHLTQPADRVPMLKRIGLRGVAEMPVRVTR
ncbi:cytochrome P450 [uncultured Maritimibacter sp.]|jgi:cytochrome P450|uniref:cytochrome P450 n=1 Tax=uncultured Maritimibacter sp. TaxID=991866 RepID=UPI000AA30887|nr:cytochrome P450 [uncultured Maritimibacter sp.]